MIRLIFPHLHNPVPNSDEVDFVFEILDHVFLPATDKVETLLKSIPRWDNADRNDFCR